MSDPAHISTTIGDDARVGRVINIDKLHAENVDFGKRERSLGRYFLPALPEPFVDRGTERAALVEALRAGQCCLLCGLPGVGKSALALRVAHDLAAEGAYRGGIFWVPLESGPSAEVAAAWLALALGVSGEAHPLRALPGLLYDRQALLIFDNAEAAVEAADALLKCRGRAAVLITSRDDQVATEIPGPPEYLAPLERGDAISLLRARLGKVPVDDGSAARICDLVGGLPLALVLAAAFIARVLRGSPDPAAEYVALLELEGLDALEMGDRRDTSVRVAFDLSWERLNGAARRALGALACAPGGSVDLGAVAAVLDGAEGTARSALRTLGRLSLAAREGDRYATHPLVRRYAHERLGTEEGQVRDRLRRYYLDYASRHAVGADQSHCAPLQLEQENVLGAMAWAWEGQAWQEVIGFAGALRHYLMLRGLAQTARERTGWWLDAAGHLEDPGERARALEALGDVHLSLAEYEGARGRYEEALPIYRAIGDRLGEANALRSLGDVHMMVDEYEGARGRYEEALPIYRAIGARLGEANAVSSLGDVHLRLAEYEGARGRYEEALPIYRAIGARLGEANALRRLAEVAQAEGEHEQAESRYQESLSISQAIGDRYGIAHTTALRGRLAADRGETEAARRLLEEAAGTFAHLGAGAEGTVRGWLASLDGD